MFVLGAKIVTNTIKRQWLFF